MDTVLLRGTDLRLPEGVAINRSEDL